MSKHIVSVPYHSQFLDVKDRHWKLQSCGIVALKMAMDFWGKKKKKTVKKLIAEGISARGYDSRWGWIHAGLVRVAKKNGFKKSFRKEWTRRQSKKPLLFVTQLLKNNIPVIASMSIGSSGHLVILTGFSEKGFFYHDPESRSRVKGKNKYMPCKKFLQIWKRRVVVIRP